MTRTQSQRELEQRVVSGLYRRLDELRAITARRLTSVRRAGPSGSPQNRSERDAFAALYEDRLAQLHAVEDRLCFGRIDLLDDSTTYIGRIGLSDDEHNPLLTDWRAESARAFYQATAHQPGDVVRRRQILTRGREVTAVEDEVLRLDLLQEAPQNLRGDGALMAALSAARTDKMHDIVSTIQSEQDEVIRADLAGTLVVQGGPGTGKTAVALHRAAYLMYAHREQLARSGVLLVGPSATFLTYIDQVLPSLGETGVVATTLGNLVPGFSASREDDPVVADLKGDLRMLQVVARAIRVRQRLPQQDVKVRVEGHNFVISRRDAAVARAKAQRSGKPHNQGRVIFVREMLNKLADQYEQSLDHPFSVEDRQAIKEDLRSNDVVRRTLNLCWLPLTAEQIVGDLWSKPHRLEQAAPHLTAEQRKLLVRKDNLVWTVSDIPLLDEAAELLGVDDQAARQRAKLEQQQRDSQVAYAKETLAATGLKGLVDAADLAARFSAPQAALNVAERAHSDRSWIFGHIIIDEAQELTAMQWHMVLRRCPRQSLTVVGDVAQCSALGGTRDWAKRFDPLLTRGWRQVNLTVNYRTPAMISIQADAVARQNGLPVSTRTAARDVANALTEHEAVSIEQLRAKVLELTAENLQALPPGGSGRVAVIGKWVVRNQLREQLAMISDPRLRVLTPVEVKGLEYDRVIIVDPDHIAAGPGGAADLYVAMTRPTQHLDIVRRVDAVV